MSIITIATTKGGAGKTTLAQIICGAASRNGHRVAAIDADLNHSLSDWISGFDTYPISTHAELNEANIVPLAEDLEGKHDVVVIDTAGASTQATVFAIGCADLVLIPVQLSSADVMEAVKTHRLVASASKMTGRSINAQAVLTDYQPHTNIAEHTEHELTTAGVPTLSVKLKRLVGFKEMTFNGEVPRIGPAGQLVGSLIHEISQFDNIPDLTKRLSREGEAA